LPLLCLSLPCILPPPFLSLLPIPLHFHLLLAPCTLLRRSLCITQLSCTLLLLLGLAVAAVVGAQIVPVVLEKLCPAEGLHVAVIIPAWKV
jgi:hypothetical protein